MKQYDVIIVGGGMVGASFAAALGPHGFKVAIVEPFEFKPFEADEPYDIRVSALTRATQRVYELIGAWDEMKQARLAPYTDMHVWDSTGSGRIDFDAADIGQPDLGHIIENRVILSALRKVVSGFEQIDLYSPSRGVELVQDEQSATLTLDSGEQLNAPLLVATDGANSWVRDQVGITTTGWAYDQTAVVATVKTSQTHAAAAWQRFTPEGPIAFLPLPEPDLSSIVWSVKPEHAEELIALDKESFLTELHNAFGDNLGSMVDCGERGAFPLVLKHANRYSEGRVVLMGNSAHAIHPLAGQGLNIGVSDVAALAELVVEAKRSDKDIGAHKLLRRYERWRKADNVAVMGAMDIFKRVYSNDNPLLSVARNVGMSIANNAGPLKDLMIKRAMGIGGDLPRMTQGKGL